MKGIRRIVELPAESNAPIIAPRLHFGRSRREIGTRTRLTERQVKSMSRSENVNLIQDGSAAQVPPRARPEFPQEAVTSSGTTPAGAKNSADNEGSRLVPRVQAKRADVERYLQVVGVRRRRMVTVTIFAAAISTLLTALAAIWGQELAEFFTGNFGPDAKSWWRILCALAAVSSLTATVATQLQTSKNYDERIARAQGTMATLEALEVAISLGHINRNEATGQYLKIIEGASFIHHPAG